MQLKYGFNNFTNTSAPEWVSLDAKKGQLKLKTPLMSSRQTFNFTLDVEVPLRNGKTKSYAKLISFAVRPCGIENCINCTPNENGDYCNACICKLFLSHCRLTWFSWVYPRLRRTDMYSGVFVKLRKNVRICRSRLFIPIFNYLFDTCRFE